MMFTPGVFWFLFVLLERWHQSISWSLDKTKLITNRRGFEEMDDILYNTQLTLGRWKNRKNFFFLCSTTVQPPRMDIAMSMFWSFCSSLSDSTTSLNVSIFMGRCDAIPEENNRPTELAPLSSQLNRFSDESSVLVRNYSILTCCLISTITGCFSIKFNWIAATGLHFRSTVRTRTTLDTEWFIRLIVNGRKTKTSQLDDKTQLPFCKQHTSALISTRHFRAREANIGNKLDKQRVVRKPKAEEKITKESANSFRNIYYRQ